MRSFWEITLLFFFPNLSSRVVHNHHLVLRGKPHPNWALYVKDILAPKILATHRTASQNKQCQPIKKSYMLGI